MCLGVRAHEIHLCGEASTVDLVKKLASLTGDSIKVITYERKTKLTILGAAVGLYPSQYLFPYILTPIAKKLTQVGFLIRHLYVVQIETWCFTRT